MKQPIVVSLILDEHGKIVQRSYQRGPKPPPWVNLSRETDRETMWKPYRYTYDANGNATMLPECKMEVSTTRFVVGEVFSVGIRGDEVPDGEEIEVTINGEVYMIEKNSHIEVETDEAGVFTVVMTDPRYFCESETVSVLAIANEIEE